MASRVHILEVSTNKSNFEWVQNGPISGAVRGQQQFQSVDSWSTKFSLLKWVLELDIVSPPFSLISNLKPVLNAVISNQDKVTKYIHVSSHLMKHFEWDKKKNKVFYILNGSEQASTDRLLDGSVVDTWFETVFEWKQKF